MSEETITNLNIEIETLENTINFGYTKLSLRCTDEIAELGALKKKRDKLVDEYTNSKNMERTKKIDALVHRSLMSVDTWHAGRPFRSKHTH